MMLLYLAYFPFRIFYVVLWYRICRQTYILNEMSNPLSLIKIYSGVIRRPIVVGAKYCNQKLNFLKNNSEICSYVQRFIMSKWLCFFAFMFSVFISNAQESKKADGWIFGPSVGYHYQNGSFLKISGWGLFAVNQSQYMKIDGGANFSWMMDQRSIIPELGLTYYLNNVAVWPFLKGEITPHTATAKAGISVFSILDIAAGYGFDIHTKPDFKPIDGFAFSISLNVPLNLHL